MKLETWLSFSERVWESGLLNHGLLMLITFHPKETFKLNFIIRAYWLQKPTPLKNTIYFVGWWLLLVMIQAYS